MRITVLTFIALSALASRAASQARWDPVPVMVPRAEHSLVQDTVNNRTLVFGGAQANNGVGRTVWSWDGTGWDPVGALPWAMRKPRAVFDPGRRRVVVLSNEAFGAGSEWDGSAWSPIPAAPLFGGGVPPQIVFDATRGVTTLVYLDVNPARVEVWEWDGLSWAQRYGASFGPPWGSFRLIRDPRTGDLLCISYGYVNRRIETWAWNGSTWRRIQHPTQPTRLEWFQIGIDPVTSDALLFGGYESISGMAQVRDEMWAFDGTDWRRLVAGPGPSPRYSHAMASTSGQLLVYGGQSFGSFGAEWYGDLWSWNGIGWSRLAETAAPPVHHDGVAVWDRSRQQLVLHTSLRSRQTSTWDGRSWAHFPCGTACPTHPFTIAYDELRDRTISVGPGGTFEWNGTGWQLLLPPSASPPGRTGARMAFDGQRVIQFGGFDGTNPTNETWAWDGSSWNQLSPPMSPPPMSNHLMASMPSRGGVVLVEEGAATWWWNGTTWTRVAAPPVAGRIGAVLSWLPARDRVVYSGGQDYDVFRQTWVPTTETWEWDGASWLPSPAAGAPYRQQRLLVEGPGERLILLGHGGQSDGDVAVAYRSANPGLVTELGSGCGGTAGVPSLSVPAWNRPLLGDAFVVDVGRLPASARISWLVLGYRTDTWNGVRLPVDLSGLGWAGCMVRLRPDSAHLLAPHSGVATWTTVVPTSGALLGLDFHLQALVPDPAANPGGFTLSDAITCRIGRR